MKKGTIQALFNEIEQFESLNQVIYGYIRIETDLDFKSYKGTILRDKKIEISGLLEYNFDNLKAYNSGEYMPAKRLTPEILLDRDLKAGEGDSILSINIMHNIDDVSDSLFSESSSWLEKQIEERYIPMNELFLVKYQFTSDVHSNAGQCNTILASDSIHNLLTTGVLEKNSTESIELPF